MSFAFPKPSATMHTKHILFFVFALAQNRRHADSTAVPEPDQGLPKAHKTNAGIREGDTPNAISGDAQE